MSLEALNQRVKEDLAYLAYGGANWVRSTEHAEGHVYDVIIVGGGQSGLGAAFGLLRERISNILVIDENKAGLEGPWETYARMTTLRTPKHLTSIDLGIPSLTFRSWWEAQFGLEGWEAVDKIPRGDWMNYLRWYRDVLNLPVINEVKLKLIEPASEGFTDFMWKVPVSMAARCWRERSCWLPAYRGGEWHVPPMIAERLPRELYAHTSEAIDFERLRGKRIAVLGEEPPLLIMRVLRLLQELLKHMYLYGEHNFQVSIPYVRWSNPG